MEGRLATGMQGKNNTNILWLLLGREARNYFGLIFFLTVLLHETLIEGRIKGKLSKGKFLGKESL